MNKEKFIRLLDTVRDGMSLSKSMCDIGHDTYAADLFLLIENMVYYATDSLEATAEIMEYLYSRDTACHYDTTYYIKNDDELYDRLADKGMFKKDEEE